MTWSRFDDAAPRNPKARAAGNDAWALWAAAIIYCNHNHTDGLVSLAALATDCLPEPITAARAKKLADKLCEAKARPDGLGLFEPAGDKLWRVHDFLDWNPSKQEVESKRRSDRERKRHGIQTDSREIPRGNPDGFQGGNLSDSGGSRAAPRVQARAFPPARPAQPSPTEGESPELVWSFDPLMNPEETPMPSGLRERALEENGAVDHLTKVCKVPRAVIVAELEDFCRYREAGAGMGDKRSYWLKHFRQCVLNRHKRNELKPVGAAEHEQGQRERQAPAYRVLKPRDDSQAVPASEALKLAVQAIKKAGGQ